MAAVWGPKIWCLLHRLSFFSNRQDVPGAWKSLLRNLNEVLPCALCKRHMREYVLKVPLEFPVGASSAVIRDTIALWLYNFHNHVNLDNGRPIFPLDLMEAQYGQGTHDGAASECRRLVSEIESMWPGINSREWRKSALYICGLIGGGPL